MYHLNYSFQFWIFSLTYTYEHILEYKYKLTSENVSYSTANSKKVKKVSSRMREKGFAFVK